MPKLLFSKIRICEFKDLIKNGRQSMGLRLDIVVSRKAQKRDIQSILHNKTKDDTYPSKISFRDNTKHHPNLERLLRDKKCLSAFRSFLQSEFSEENIEFWLACEDFRKSPSADGLSSKADEIYQEFLHPSAQREINVDHYIREKIQKSLVKPSFSCFDDAQRHVYQLMERDSCSRFLRSDTYLSLRRRNRILDHWWSQTTG